MHSSICHSICSSAGAFSFLFILTFFAVFEILVLKPFIIYRFLFFLGWVRIGVAKPLAILDEFDADGSRTVVQDAIFTGKNCFYYFLCLSKFASI